MTAGYGKLHIRRAWIKNKRNKRKIGILIVFESKGEMKKWM